MLISGALGSFSKTACAPLTVSGQQGRGQGSWNLAFFFHLLQHTPDKPPVLSPGQLLTTPATFRTHCYNSMFETSFKFMKLFPSVGLIP